MVLTYTQPALFWFVNQPSQTVSIADNSQPFFADLNGDLRNEMLYNAPKNDSIMVQKLGSNESALPFSSPTYQNTQDPECLTPVPTSVLSTPHSAAFFDIDGDCMPDLFLTKQNDYADGQTNNTVYEIYIQRMVDGK